MNNTKKIVRLTESQLHDIIAESVSQILTELDWKTAASAARKQISDREWQGRSKRSREMPNHRKLSRAQKFADYAKEKFNDEFASPNGEYSMTSFFDEPEPKRYIDHYGGKWGDEFQGSEPIYDDEEEWATRSRMYDSPIRTSIRMDDGYGDHDGRSYTDVIQTSFDPEWNKYTVTKPYLSTSDKEILTPSKETKAAQRKGDKEIGDFISGKYKYKKGKGWRK